MSAIPQQQVQRKRRARLFTELASSAEEIRESQRLRYNVFAGELGATLKGAERGLDEDRYDEHCRHLLVREAESGQVIASTRLLTDEGAAKAGGFYSASEFDLGPLLNLPGRRLEVGRTCVHPEFRSGAAIAVLWSGLAGFINLHGFDYLFGCASIDLADGGVHAEAIMRRLRNHAMSPEDLRVTPHLPLQPLNIDENVAAPLPPLLKAYVRLGARACGEACLDPDFNVADVLVLLDLDNLDPTYSRHFMERAE